MRPPRLSDYPLSGQRIEKIFRAGVAATLDGAYLSWDELATRQPPAGIPAHEWWIGTRLVRRAISVPVGRFTVALAEPVVAGLHRVDRPGLAAAPARLVVSARIDEAVASAQLAGAGLSRDAARELLRARRRPTDADEALVRDTYDRLERPAPSPGAPAPTERAVHPVLAAIVDHLAADDPRLGRARFYARLRAAGYDFVDQLSISTVIRRDPDAYARARDQVERDDGDATYFALHQLAVLDAAIDDARRTLAHKTRELADARALAPDLNDRQLALLQHALAHPDARYTIAAHQASHAIVYETARADLRELEAAELIQRGRAGRAFVYTPAPELSARLARR